MPLYDFDCNECEHTFEALSCNRHCAETYPPYCPECGSKDTKKSEAMSAPSRTPMKWGDTKPGGYAQ